MSPEVAPQGLRFTFPLTLALTCYCPAYVALVPWATVFPSPFSAWFSPAEAQGRAESLFHDCPLELPGQLNLVFLGGGTQVSMFFKALQVIPLFSQG